MLDENDDYYREEGAWMHRTTHIHMLNEKIIELRHALRCAIIRLDAAKKQGIDLEDDEFSAMVAHALSMEADDDC